MGKAKSQSPTRTIHRNMKRDALTQDRRNGCRCPNTRAHLKPGTEDREMVVVTTPHRDDCPLREAEAEITGTPLAVPPTTTSGLWTP